MRIGGVFIGCLFFLRGIFFIYVADGKALTKCRRGCEVENIIYMFFGDEFAHIFYGAGWILFGFIFIYSAIQFKKSA
jgi:hypothetical protein